jgi:hypothetical protein
MACVYIAAITIALCASPVLAQEPAEATLTVTVTDQTGAVIPGARVTAIREDSHDDFRFLTDARGVAVLQLQPGIYNLRVVSQGFAQWAETGLDVTGKIEKSVVLRVSSYSGPMVIADTVSPPVDLPVVEALIPLEPVQELVLTPTKLPSHRRH